MILISPELQRGTQMVEGGLDVMTVDLSRSIRSRSLIADMLRRQKTLRSTAMININEKFSM